jgi:peptidoglycan biosynthesis protein MviN/MurJ (putative lipid II flippase)
MRMLADYTETAAKIIPTLGIAAVVEMRYIRKAIRRRQKEAGKNHAKLGFRVATATWVAVIVALITAEMMCLDWLSYEHPAEGDFPVMAQFVYWVVAATFILLVVVPAFLNLRRWKEVKFKEEEEL